MKKSSGTPSAGSAIYRYVELDWLRVILILAVFVHHVFMPFNGDGWHVMNADSSKVLDDIMVYFEQLRLQTLFFIAGAGSFLLLGRMQGRTFLRNKFHRLFVPFMVGMIFIVPPQNYIENIADYNGWIAAYSSLMLSFEANHLWFIEFLIVFMVLAVPLYKYLCSATAGRFFRALENYAGHRYGLLSLVIIIILIRGALKLVFPTQDHSVFNLSVSVFFLLFFVAGMCFIARERVWQAIKEHRRTNLMWLIISSALFYAYYYSPDLSAYASLEVRWQLWWLLCTLVSWSAMLTMVGYAQAFCSSSPKCLLSANELIYPFYILHQTIIVLLAFYIVQWQTGIAIKSMVLLLTSFAICVASCYLIIKPFKPMRYLFGLKVTRDTEPTQIHIKKG